MPIERTRQDPSADADGPPTFVTDDTHWWDGSQIYGRDPAYAAAIRTGARGKLTARRARAASRSDIEARRRPHRRRTGTSGSGSRCCTRSSRASTTRSATTCTRPTRSWDDDELFDKARLVIAALMAKIHTVEWTPAIIAHPTTVRGMRANWWGLDGEAARPALRPLHVERGDPRHPRLADEPPRRPLLAHRGVRRRLPDAPADPGRLQLPLARDRRGAPGAHARRDRRAARARASDRDVDERPALLVRHLASRRDHAAQLPALPAGLPPRRRRRTSTWPRSTSCACASAACRATTSSGGCST